jgi:hypothetical protein
LKLDELLQLSSNLEEAVEIPVEICPLSEMPWYMRYKIITRDEKLPIRTERLLHEIRFAAFSERQDRKMLMQSLKKRQCQVENQFYNENSLKHK